MAKHETAVPLDRIDDHAATLAWRTIEDGDGPTSIEVLKPEKRRSSVFRLNGIGPAEVSIIAKRRQPGELDLEHRLYAEVLPSLPLSAPRLHGFVEGADGWSWLFVEDAGETWYAPEAPEHRALAVSWLASLHTRSSDLAAPVPETGPPYFRSVLDAGLEGVREGLSHSSLSGDDRSVLRSVASQLELVALRWEDVEAACATAPTGLVHGDFVPKNVRARPGRDGLELVAFDWETAGVASPAADIGLLPDEDSLRRYHELVSEAWPQLSFEDVRRLAWAGRLLRLLNCVHWEARSFLYPWVEHTMRRMRAYERALRESERPGARAAS